MTTLTQTDLQGLLIIRLSDKDLLEQDATTQIRTKLGFVAESANISKLLINLENVTFLSSESIGQLIMLKKKCDQKQITLALSNISPKNLKVLRLVRCDELIDLYEDQQSAIDALATTVQPTPNQPLSAAEHDALLKRAESGDVESMVDLARRLSDGRGLEQDPVEAATWYEKAAKHGHIEAQYELATCYAFGLGVAQDYGKAIPWYDKAAGLGHADSQYMIGMSFQYSLNDVSDQELAKSWYHKAAEQGHEKSKLALEELE